MAIIPKEDVAAYERWQAGSFDAGQPGPKKNVPPKTSAVPRREGDSGTVTHVKLPTAEEIENIHNTAQQEGHRLGHEAGYQAGYEAGMQAARTEAQKLAALVTNLQQALLDIDQQVADSVLELSLEVARQVIRSSLACQPEAILPLIREAITSLPLHHGNISIVLNPEDARRLQAQLGNQIAQSGWHLIEDADIAAGGCLIRTGSSEIDATLATRWRRVIEMIGVPPDEPPP